MYDRRKKQTKNHYHPLVQYINVCLLDKGLGWAKKQVDFFRQNVKQSMLHVRNDRFDTRFHEPFTFFDPLLPSPKKEGVFGCLLLFCLSIRHSTIIAIKLKCHCVGKRGTVSVRRGHTFVCVACVNTANHKLFFF